MKSKLFPTNSENSGSTPLKYNQKLDLQHFPVSPTLIRSFTIEANRNLTNTSRTELRTDRNTNQSNISINSFSPPKHNDSQIQKISLNQSQILGNSLTTLKSPSKSHSKDFGFTPIDSSLHISNGLKSREDERLSKQKQFLMHETNEMKHWINDKRFGLLVDDLDKSFTEIEEDYRIKKYEKQKPESKWTEQDENRYKSPKNSQFKELNSFKLDDSLRSNNSNLHLNSPNRSSTYLPYTLRQNISTTERNIDPIEYAQLVANPELAGVISCPNDALNATYQYASPDHRKSYHYYKTSADLSIVAELSKNLNDSKQLHLSHQISSINNENLEKINYEPASNNFVHSNKKASFENVDQLENKSQISETEESYISHEYYSEINDSLLQDIKNVTKPDESIIIQSKTQNKSQSLSQNIIQNEEMSNIIYVNPKDKYKSTHFENNISLLRVLFSSNQISYNIEYDFRSIYTIVTGKSNIWESELYKSISDLQRAILFHQDQCVYSFKETQLPKLHKYSNESNLISRQEFVFASKFDNFELEDSNHNFTIVLYKSKDTSILLNKNDEKQIIKRNMKNIKVDEQGSIIFNNINLNLENTSSKINSDDLTEKNTVSVHFHILKDILKNEILSSQLLTILKSFKSYSIDVEALPLPKSIEGYLSQLKNSSRSFEYLELQLFKRLSNIVEECGIDPKPVDGYYTFYMNKKITEFSKLSKKYRLIFQLIMELLLFEVNTLNNLTNREVPVILINNIDQIAEGKILKQLETFLYEFSHTHHIQLICFSQNDSFIQPHKFNSNIMCLISIELSSIYLSDIYSLFGPYFQRLNQSLWKQLNFIEKLSKYKKIVFVETRDDLKILKELIKQFVPDSLQIRKRIVWIILSDLFQLDISQSKLGLDLKILSLEHEVRSFVTKTNSFIHQFIDIESNEDIQTFFILNGSWIQSVDQNVMIPWKSCKYHQWSKRNLLNHLISLPLLQKIVPNLSISDLKQIICDSYNIGAEQTGDSGIYSSIFDLASSLISNMNQYESDFQNYLIQRDLTVSDLERIFETESGVVIKSLKENIIQSLKNKRIINRVDLFMHHNQLPIRISEESLNSLTINTALSFIHVPSLLVRLENSVLQLVSNPNSINSNYKSNFSLDHVLKVFISQTKNDSSNSIGIDFSIELNNRTSTDLFNQENNSNLSLEDLYPLDNEIQNILNQLAKFAYQ